MADLNVRVDLGPRTYEIFIEPGLLPECGRLAAAVLPPPRKMAVITNDKIGALYGDVVTESFATAGYEVIAVDVPDGEGGKSLESAERLYGRLLAAGADRTSTVAALGGGVVGDLAGFVAATYMRGIPFMQIPTSLLAQVDSSVGGKTAVNHPLAKNIIGVFHQPSLVVIDPEVLTTLPKREFAAGLSEVIKYAFIAGRPLYDRVTKGLPFNDPAGDLAQVISDCCEYKAKIVEEDERDVGVRAFLNYGHTIGHAIEAVSGYKHYNHGEAVAVGMIGAAFIGRKMGLLNTGEEAAHVALIKDAGLPVEAGDIDPDAVFNHLQMDKKRVEGRDYMVLLNGIGRPELHEVPPELIREAIEALIRPGVLGEGN